MSTEIRVPTLGESVTEATVATWFKKLGDHVAVDEMLCELETDKVTVEVPSPVAGTISEIVAPEGSTVSVEALLAQISEGAAAPEPAAVSRKTPEAESVTVMVPTLGESVSEATVATWYKQPGDSVTQDEILCELETDKVSVEVPAPAAGILGKTLAPEGSTVQAGGQLAVISSAVLQAPTSGTADAAPSGRKDLEDAPSAKKLMAETGLDRSKVTATGKDGRVMKEDVQTVLAAKPATLAIAMTPASPPRAAVPVEDAAREERVKMTRLRQTIA
ncbi:MAG: biotin/lipoyl-containing protein, partial [Rhodobacterales bacterium]